MVPFLKDIARFLYSTYGDKLADCCLVFPNQRAGLFLKKYLSELVPKPVWSPEVLTISDLITDLSDLSVADDLYLLFELYDIYCDEKKSGESFDNFYFWGEIMLADFDDIDKYLVNAADLFRNITALRSIEEEFSYLSEEQIRIIQRFWQSFSPTQPGQQDLPGEHSREFLNTWEILNKIYTRLKEKLKSEKLGYEGMVYRRVADLIDEDNLPSLSFIRIFFIGFNALNECEKKLFRYFQKQGKASFLWDFDDYYYKDKNHEAGRFIRENLREFGMDDNHIPYNNLLNKKDIQIISIPSNVGQARILPDVLSGFNDNSPETAIILPDENLLLPVIHSLPESLHEFNVTMGYPVLETQLYSLIGHIIRLQENVRLNENGSCKYYSQDVLAILNHPSVNRGYEGDFRKIIELIIKQNLIFVDETILNEHPALRLFFIRIEDQGNVLQYLLNILEEIARRSPVYGTQMADQDNLKQDQFNQGQDLEGQIPGREDQSREREDQVKEHNDQVQARDNPMQELENEIIFQIFTRIKRLNEILQGRKVELRIGTLYRLIRKILMNTRIPFSGEPLTGLQIMGVLETRVLDFRNLVLLSMNEGIFPKSPVRYSFIPHNLRRGFNLPTVEHHDAIYSYYFYRLVQRAEKIVLVYNSKSEGLTSGEQSRFLYQLTLSKLLPVKEKIIAYNIQSNPERPVTIMKDTRITDRLREYIRGDPSNKYLSPSALNMYLDCSLKFYFRFIADLEEPEELKEETDPLLFGILLHSAVNSLYSPFGKEMISADLLKGLLLNNERIGLSVSYAFKEVYRLPGDMDKIKIEGRNAIIGDILVKYLREIIERDIHYTPFSIVDMEKKIKTGLQIRHEKGNFEAIIGGKIDRIDYMANKIRILDYKTGRVVQKINSVNELFDRNKKDRSSEVFQILLYAKLIHSSEPDLTALIVPGLYPVMELNKEEFDYHISIGESRKKEILGDFRIINDEFTAKLTETVLDIFNPEVPFSPTGIIDRCRNCPYRKICHR
jgi:hypothetical protein